MKRKVIFASITLLLAAAIAKGQTKQPSWHTVRGVVVDRMGRPVATATVCLRDLAGHRLRMKQTDRTGSFSFGLVNLATDREVYAEQGGSASQKVPIAGSGTERDIVVQLKLENGSRLGDDSFLSVRHFGGL